MRENESDSLPFDSPEQENARLKDEKSQTSPAAGSPRNCDHPVACSGTGAGHRSVDGGPLDREERACQRVALFRSLLRGREDVYARRWEKGDHSGYSPAAARDWKAIQHSRPEDRKRVERETRRFFPNTAVVIESHLLGEETIGVYPLLSDESGWLLAADLDKKTWEYDSLVFFFESCQELEVPAYRERSRSGKGGHIWIFFDRALPAITAGKLGCAILTRSMERRHQIGLDSYDRFCPNQDTMPKGGFGNLIALPLQRLPRKAGSSVFINAELDPYPDQRQFLASITKMTADVAEEIVAKAQRKGDLIGVRMSLTDEDVQDPWAARPSRERQEKPIDGSLPRTVQVVRANLVASRVPCHGSRLPRQAPSQVADRRNGIRNAKQTRDRCGRHPVDGQ